MASERFNRWLSIWLGLFLLLSSFACYYQIHYGRLLGNPYTASGWSLTQLKSEYQQLLHLLQMFDAGRVSAYEVGLQYDVLQEFPQTLLDGNGRQALEPLEGALALILQIDYTLRDMKPQLLEVLNGHVDYLQLYNRLAPFSPDLNALLSRYFQAHNSYQDNSDAKGSLQQVAWLGFVASLVATGLAGWLFWHQWRQGCRAAERDRLTGLADRLHVQRVLRQRIERSQPFTLVVVEILKFQQLNQRLPMALADQLLVELSQRLRQVAGSVLSGRLHGDQFALLLPACREEQLEAVCVDLSQRLEEIYYMGRHWVDIKVSLGVSRFTDAQQADQDVLGQALIAVLAAKQRGEGWLLFSPEMQRDQVRHHSIVRKLRQAIDLNHLQLNYQPIYQLQDNRIVAVEALLRWQHDELQALPTREVIAVAESEGLAVILGRLVVEQVCGQLRHWQRLGLGTLRVSINVSSAMLKVDLAQLLQPILAQHAVAPSQLILDVPEALIRQGEPGLLQQLTRLKTLGVGLAIDDFGAGLSCLGEMFQLPFDLVKMDGRLLQDPVASSQCQLLQALIDLAHRLGLEVVLEGIENREQQQRISELEGICYGQGFALHRPIGSAGMTHLLLNSQAGWPWKEETQAERLAVAESPAGEVSTSLSGQG